MLEVNNKNYEINNPGVVKVGHFYENVKFDCNDNIENISTDFHNDYLEIIQNAANRNYDALNKLIDSTFNADIKVLEDKLKNSLNISSDAKKKFFFNDEEGKIIDDFRNYIKIVYLERILFDILNLGLKDLENNSIEKILESKQENRINSFINSMTNDKNNEIPDNSFKPGYSERVKDKKNYLRYVIYFYCLKKSLSSVQKEMEKLKSYVGTQEEILKNNPLIKNNAELTQLKKDINQLNRNMKKRQKQLHDPNSLTQHEKKKIKEKLFEHVNFISKEYGNDLKSAQHILEDIQKSWANAFDQFIYLYMLENPDQITKLRKSYELSIWGFVDFLLDHKEHQNFSRALYEIDKTKSTKDFKSKSREDEKRQNVLQNKSDTINQLNKNQRKLVNDLIKNRCHLENSWMRKAFWILFASISSFVVISMAPLLAIIIPDIIMVLGALFVTLLGVGLIILLITSGSSNFGGGEGMARFLIWSLCAFKNMPWLTFRSIPIQAYYCSTFFSVAMPIATVVLIAAIAFYIYEKHQFNSIVKVPNLQQQQPEIPKIEQAIENYRNIYKKHQLNPKIKVPNHIVKQYGIDNSDPAPSINTNVQ